MTQMINDKGKAPQKLVYAKSAAARTKGDVVYLGMDSAGWKDVTLVDDAVIHCIAVADQDIASGVTGQYVVEGEVVATVPSATYTAGNGLIMFNGLVTDSAAVFPVAGVAGDAQTVFGVTKTGGVAVTSITMVLHGKTFTATT